MQSVAATHGTNPSTWFSGLDKWTVSWKLHGIRINLNSCYLYLLLVVSSPMLSSLPLSSSHALSVYREISPPFPPFALFSSLTLFHHWFTCFTVQMSQKCFFLFLTLWLPSTLLWLHSQFWSHHWSGWTTLRERRSRGVERAGRGGDVGQWEMVSRLGFPTFPRSKSGKRLIQS